MAVEWSVCVRVSVGSTLTNCEKVLINPGAGRKRERAAAVREGERKGGGGPHFQDNRKGPRNRNHHWRPGGSEMTTAAEAVVPMRVCVCACSASSVVSLPPPPPPSSPSSNGASPNSIHQHQHQQHPPCRSPEQSPRVEPPRLLLPPEARGGGKQLRNSSAARPALPTLPSRPQQWRTGRTPPSDL